MGFVGLNFHFTDYRNERIFCYSVLLNLIFFVDCMETSCPTNIAKRFTENSRGTPKRIYHKDAVHIKRVRCVIFNYHTHMQLNTPWYYTLL